MERLTLFFARLFGPIMRPVSRWLLSERRRWFTWVYEYAFTASLLVPVTLYTMHWSQPRAVIANVATALGVFFSFGHAKVTSRMSEAMAVTERPTVPCYRWADRYWLMKELAWFTAFVASGLWPALVGSVLFLLYPAWRKVHVETRLAVRGTRLDPHQVAALAQTTTPGSS